jgi:hypothetical protein
MFRNVQTRASGVSLESTTSFGNSHCTSWNKCSCQNGNSSVLTTVLKTFWVAYILSITEWLRKKWIFYFQSRMPEHHAELCDRDSPLLIYIYIYIHTYRQTDTYHANNNLQVLLNLSTPQSWRSIACLALRLTVKLFFFKSIVYIHILIMKSSSGNQSVWLDGTCCEVVPWTERTGATSIQSWWNFTFHQIC